MRHRSFIVAAYWVLVVIESLVGNILVFWGFGNASESLNKRVRDTTFTALLRQEVAFFDKRSVGSVTSQLQDDAARIHAFSGEPVRSLIVAVSSVVTGVIISLVVSTIADTLAFKKFTALTHCFLVHVAICAACYCMHTPYGFGNVSEV
jgi:ATP-binding cassette subfamily B (MDR/TAP) protein 1